MGLTRHGATPGSTIVHPVLWVAPAIARAEHPRLFAKGSSISMKNTKLFFLAALAATAVACSSSSAGTSPSTPGAGGASTEQVSSCKQSCDKMKFFECNSAEEQARCYNDCNAATSDQIQLFTACADNSVCDPACRTNIQPKPSGGGSSGGGSSGGGSTGGGGATAATCTTACQKLVQCSFIRVGDEPACEAQCTQNAYQYQIDCVNNTTCPKMQTTCGAPVGIGGGGSTGGGGGDTDAGPDEFEIAICQDACDSMSTFRCVDATDHAACRDLCTTAPANKRDSFRTCEDANATDCTKSNDCYDAFKAP